jgi:hypothetical protein
LSRPRIPPKKQQQSIGVAQRVVSRLTCKAMAAGEGDKKPNGLVLLDFWVSPFGQRCRIALAEKGLEYEYSEQELLGGKKSELCWIDPNGHPTSRDLVSGGPPDPAP